MKRMIAFVLLVCLSLCACGNTQDTPVTTTAAPTQVTTEPTVETTEATQPATTEAEAEVLYRHPLTGEVLAEPFTTRPVALSMGNSKGCLPQYGLSKADIVHEIETEGGITRLLVVFTDLENAGQVGPIRSARTYFNHLATSYNAPLFHCGGSPDAKAGKYDLNNKLAQWNHVDQISNSKYFYRDSDRKAQGYKTEHTLFTTGEKLMTAMTDKKFETAEVVDYGYQFAETPEFTGETANRVLVAFRGSRSTEMKYDAATGLYKSTQFYGSTKKTHIDGQSDEQLTYRNVLVLMADQKLVSDGYTTRSYYQLTGSGKGYFACDGKIVPIKWTHSKVTDSFRYTLEDGTPLTLGVGRSYVGIISDSQGKVTYK